MTTTPTELTKELINRIHTEGKIAFSTFMELALYHPNHGYYNRNHFVLGKNGDFTTAPEISPLFGYCFANQCREILKQLNGGAILELGAGSGQFAVDILTKLKELNQLPDFYAILEISPHLRGAQQTKLKAALPDYFDHIQWLEGWPNNFEGVIIANEVLDALPVDCFAIKDDQIKERTVTYKNNCFQWEECEPITPGLKEAAETLRQTYHLSDYQSEINLRMNSFVQSMVNALKRGVILLADYGYGQREYYHPQRNHGTLTCFYQHQKSDNPFKNIGEQDITAHVDFTSVIEQAHAAGADLEGFTSQSSFLLANHLLKFAEQMEKEISEAEKVSLHHAIKLLTMPTEMGDVIKVMGLGKGIQFELSGFKRLDRSRDLD